MAKVFISNNFDWQQSMRQEMKKVGFKSSLMTQYVDAYHKLNFVNENAFMCGEDYVVCVGTWTYKGCNGIKGLKNIYNDLVEGNSYKEIRRKLLGCYGLITHIDGFIKVLVDETHSYTLYYGKNDDDEYVITNKYFHIQKYLQSEIDRDKYVTVATVGSTGNQTPFRNIFRLMEDEIIEIDRRNGSFKISNIPVNSYSYEYKSIDSICDKLAELFVESGKNLSNISSNRTIFLTGGVDSRVYLSLDVYLGNHINLAYWDGKDSITNGTNGDIKVNERIATTLDLQTKVFDVAMDFKDCVNQLDDNILWKYGEDCHLYANNNRWFSIFENTNNQNGYISEFIEFGCMGEAIRENGNINKTYNKNYQLRDLINLVLLRSGILHRLLEFNNLEECIFKDIAERHKGLTLDSIIDIDIADKIFTIKRLDADNSVSNLVNMYCYSCSPIICKPVWDFVIGIPYKYKYANHLPLSLIEKWDKRLLNIPFYTHNHFEKYDRKSNTLRRKKLHAFLSWLKPYVLDTKVYDILYKKIILSKTNKKSDINEKVREMCISYFTSDSKNFTVREQYYNDGYDVSALAQMMIFDMGINMLI
ncbi:MAG: hypothetical protein OSJ38_03705 [Lachnospiraceae bacterium]|nr:hypothetical protein [Lachnospiraceae bacterium]